jgi:hypothetical protein
LVFVYERKEMTDRVTSPSSRRIGAQHVLDVRFKRHAQKAKTRKQAGIWANQAQPAI